MAAQPSQRFVSQQSTQPQALSQVSSQPTPPETTSSHSNRRSSISQSTTSEDSQIVLLNHPSSSEPSPKPEEQQQRRASPRLEPQTASSDSEPQKCWICFGDETEDSPTSSEWRSPCPCALTAHESCLLDWVADLEAPNKRRPAKIECPQCKAKITIARPRSPIVEFVRVIERVTGRLLIPFVLVTLAGTVAAGCWVHGYSTIYLMCGPEDAERLLGIDSGLQINRKMVMSLPLIPLALIGARTNYLDNLLPIIPIFYLASNTPRREGPLWPPSAAFALSTLPYIRAAYNELYSRVLAPKEKAWIKEVQPRAGEIGENEPQEQQGNQENADDVVHEGINFELNLQVELIDEEEADREVEVIRQQPEQPAGNRDQAEQGQGQNQGPNERHGHPHPPPAPQLAANQGAPAGANIMVDAVAYAQKALGALMFPTIAAAMGFVLKAALPRTWTTSPGRWDRYPTGFLQSQFGRSVAGGCLFVALRDTLLLYSRYRLAQDHRMRRVVNYDVKKGRKVKTTES